MRAVRSVREIAETILVLALVIAASMLIPVTWVSSHLIFSAFFLLVFAVAMRYQRVTAYCAGVLAAASYLFLLWRLPALGQNASQPYVFIEPFLLFVSGIIMSDSISAQRQRYARAQQKQSETEAHLQEITQHYQKALAINARLEQQISGQAISLETISEKILHLWKASEHERYGAIIDLVMHAIEADTCTLYIRQHGRMSLALSRSSSGEVKPNAPLRLDDPLISRVLHSYEIATIQDVLEDIDNVAQEVAVMAGPLFDEDGQVAGILVINSIALLKFTPGTVHLFRSMLQIASLALQTIEPVSHVYVQS
jgi:hypothetical protein